MKPCRYAQGNRAWPVLGNEVLHEASNEVPNEAPNEVPNEAPSEASSEASSEMPSEALNASPDQRDTFPAGSAGINASCGPSRISTSG